MPPWNWAIEVRKTIKGHDRDYYVGILHEVREKTLTNFRQRDDAWLLAIDKAWPWGPSNDLCKWLHVCEHEAHHTGQVAPVKETPSRRKDRGRLNTVKVIFRALRPPACECRP